MVFINSENRHNYEAKFIVAEDLILKWKRRMLTTLGRISIAKALLLFKYVYCFTCIDATENMIKKIQVQLDNFIRRDTRRNWIGEELLYTSKDIGGLGFFRLTDFIDVIKITWVRRYRLGTSDHWCDLIDQSLNLNERNRKKLWRMGDQSFQNLFDAKLFGLSSISKLHARFSREFPQQVELRESSWISQTFFANKNIVTKIPDRRARGFKLLPVSQTYRNLPPNTTINLNGMMEDDS